MMGASGRKRIKTAVTFRYPTGVCIGVKSTPFLEEPMRRTTLALFILAALATPAIDAQQAPAPRIADRTGGAQRADGFIPFYWDTARGRVLIEVPAFGEDVLY